MAYDTRLADRIRDYLENIPDIEIEERKMFRGMTSMVNGKMCVNVSGQNLMCRFDPTLTDELEEKIGFLPMLMKSKKYEGYCYIEPIGLISNEDIEFWINLCLDFNEKVKPSKR